MTRREVAKKLGIPDFRVDDMYWDMIDVEKLLDLIRSIQFPETKKMKSIVGKSICPFCSGTKTLPYVRYGMNQDCHECDSDGKISNKKLFDMGLEDFIKK
jgi:hypothetical protein